MNRPTKLTVTLVLACLLAAPLQAVESYRLKYTVTWGVFVVYETTIDLVKTDSAYRIVAGGKTKGLASLFSGGRNQVSSEGILTESGPLPVLYESQGKFEGERFHRAVLFDGDGYLSASAKDWPEKWSKYQREPVPENLQKGPDPLSLLTLLADPNSPANQILTSDNPLVFRAFDGRTVVDYKFTCKLQPELLKKSGKSLFAGEARACYSDFDLVAGQVIETEELRKEREKRRKKEAKRKKPKDTDEDKPDDDRLKIWLAKIDGLPSLIPVRAAAKAGLGTVRIYLRDVETRGDPIPLKTKALDKDFCKKVGSAIPSPYC